MLSILQEYLTDKIVLSETELFLIDSVSIVKKIRKKQFLLEAGEVWKYNAFVCKGLIKTFSIDKDGKEHIINFSPENYWFGDRESLTNNTPSKFNIDAIENSEIILIKKEDFEMLCNEIPSFNNLVNTILQKSFMVSQNRIHANISFSAEEKYQNFLESNPLLINRIPQHMIGAYLGITPETITRIRRNPKK
ncbi:Crp/Fnr family transcriptional regulator [Flavobacterium sp. MMLR14_040]|uniref:Crp/Fnr family transcriptional regulator n=1 Tax=Flavobacterium sp. MMLR14_040 TaxID=3093843 RepID=UPI000EB10410|nr:Crp/Fnr family transcriptional regulator [Flavobacterium sp. MMLR14_040]MDW8848960.1 Crp/Fnr family transcriptional regulator [Flavobacterium sp. MMLR14_040]